MPLYSRFARCLHSRLKRNPNLRVTFCQQQSDVTSVDENVEVNEQFVPKVAPLRTSDVEAIQQFVSRSHQILVITGAGLSTESGIPDYRSEGVGLYSKSSFRPVQHAEFIKFPDRRKMYWARNYIGWPQFNSREPNISHRILAQWEKAGKVSWLVTQNVDSLHTKAGSKKVIELHGSSRKVVCLNCQKQITRDVLQEMMHVENPLFDEEPAEIAPDGDVILTREQVKRFNVPPCQSCGGTLKPQVVFFGDNVPRNIVDFVYKKVSESDALLVVGSSLQVFSAFRFVRAAFEEKKPIAIINIGPTRADKFVNLKVNAKLGDILPLIRV